MRFALRMAPQRLRVRDSDILTHIDAFRLENRGEHRTMLDKLELASEDLGRIRGDLRDLTDAVAENTAWRQATTEAIGLGQSPPSVWAANWATMIWWFPKRAGVLFLAIIYATVPEARDLLKQSAAQIAAAWKAWNP